MRKRRWYGGGLAVAVLTLLLGAALVHRSAIYSRTYRIGFESEPPFHFPDAEGKPAGLAVDILNEAARRTGIRLQWVFGARSSEMELRSGGVDLWPIMTIREERRPYLYFTDPYRESESQPDRAADRPYSVLADLNGGTDLAQRTAADDAHPQRLAAEDQALYARGTRGPDREGLPRRGRRRLHG